MVSAFSTPSAITTRFRLRARPVVERTMALSYPVSTMSVTKDRSIFNALSGSLRR
jgi:hypothetical protein